MPGTIIKANAKVGDSVFFGTYPQTAEGNDRTPIEWIVLEVQENRLFLLSKYGIDAGNYNDDSDAYVTWETCTLREWLNCEFLASAFSEFERSAILSTELDNAIQSWHLVTGGKNTIDKVFLLKWIEADRYVNGSENGETPIAPQMKPTEYAAARGRSEEGWFLREPGHAQYSVAYMLNGNWRRCTLRRIEYVRPALWVRLNPAIND